MTDKIKNYPRERSCPCGSGLKYLECCQKKGIGYGVDKGGKATTSVKISNALNAAMIDSQNRFKAIFGRAMKNEPFLFDQHLDEDPWKEFTKLAKKQKVREEIIYATLKTECMITEENRELFPDYVIKDWNDSVKEYRRIKSKGFDPFHTFTYLSAEEFHIFKNLNEKIDSVIIVLGMAINNPKKSKESSSYFASKMLRKIIKAARVVKHLQAADHAEASLSVARGIYEAYLRLKLLRLAPESSDRFEAMILSRLGIWPTKLRKNGKPHYGVCVDPATGQEYNVEITNKEIIEISDFAHEAAIYYAIYPLLSSFVHPDPTTDAIRDQIDKQEPQTSQIDNIFSTIFIMLISFLLLLEASQLKFIRKITRRDILYIAKQIYIDLSMLIVCESILKKCFVPKSVYDLFEIPVQNQSS